MIRGQIFPGLTSVLRERFGTFSSNGNLEPYLSQRCHVQIKYRALQISNVDVDPHPPLLPPPFRFPLPQTPLEVMKREGGRECGRQMGCLSPPKYTANAPRACVRVRLLSLLAICRICRLLRLRRGTASITVQLGRTELTEEHGMAGGVETKHAQTANENEPPASVFTQIRSANFWNILYSFRTSYVCSSYN